ncbi:TM1802 family CRISPR-associated protein [Methylomusa anaerophila]|uniref:CRISPR-associated protein n=1 Tax=Methylomusa anaerophila TaxID=1930071 RepID=A0A348AR37_9FIRM|nr:TM1802 family CRISPR-associated protein [Methylomusa anaerophila]BBB93535.1 hypothetical protein MAMMFC1_04253 [Methylomusa anaerophila]
MNLDWLGDFSDPYLRTPLGQGVFLSGIILGVVAKGQVGNSGDIDSAPMFKQIMFGKMQRRDLLRHLARVPELLGAYDGLKKSAPYIRQLSGKTGELLLKGGGELGVEGNFAFSVAFLNARDYYWKIFGKSNDSEAAEE